MAMAAKWRNLLAILVVFAVSPLSMCASTACNLTCSFHDAAIPGPRLIGPERQQAVEVSVKHDPGILCHGPADSEGAPSLAFRNHQGPCHREKWLSLEVVVAPALAQGKCADPTQAINVQPSAAISPATPSLGVRHRSRNSRARLPDVFAVSRILRI